MNLEYTYKMELETLGQDNAGWQICHSQKRIFEDRFLPQVEVEYSKLVLLL